MENIAKLIDNMCMNDQTGLIFESNGVSDDWLIIWRQLEIPRKYRTENPYYNLYIWNLESERIQIWLETVESAKHKEIISTCSDAMVGTLFKYSL